MNLFVFKYLPFGNKPMNRLNGPYAYFLQRRPVGDLWEVCDKDSNTVAVCETSYLAQMVASELTGEWKREVAAIEVAERVERE